MSTVQEPVVQEATIQEPVVQVPSSAPTVPTESTAPIVPTVVEAAPTVSKKSSKSKATKEVEPAKVTDGITNRPEPKKREVVEATRSSSRTPKPIVPYEAGVNNSIVTTTTLTSAGKRKSTPVRSSTRSGKKFKGPAKAVPKRKKGTGPSTRSQS